jgi:sigma54-dependent transcription regulator
LRVLQEQELERIGDTRTRKVSVRVIAATNRDLKKEVDQGRFREDLFYRLSVFPIEAPPLRKRSDDIAKLAAHFIRQRAAEEDDRDGARRLARGATRAQGSFNRSYMAATHRAGVLRRIVGGPHGRRPGKRSHRRPLGSARPANRRCCAYARRRQQ